MLNLIVAKKDMVSRKASHDSIRHPPTKKGKLEMKQILHNMTHVYLKKMKIAPLWTVLVSVVDSLCFVISNMGVKQLFLRKYEHVDLLSNNMNNS